ncbi:Glycosyl transferases group 1 [Sporotomaculum syntrophicum]|uniref:Glycosyl transferases group 1 n=1 Tax=Sporotomaculum syntrophicum TaxID=182264 RepID=A0A9D2WRB1_9FIRM|nr:glycosyltransferase family 4 protein [Sporotomaculum syntrophicum]KAF1085939.1 Glycosyl transferases group 1 [Sporotomaculum syntrophicum]
MKVLFLTNTPINGPSARYRVYQYLPLIEQNNIQVATHSALTPFLFSKFSPAKGNLNKFIYFFLSALSRIIALFRLPFYNVIFIQKLVLPHVFPLPEFLLCKLSKRLCKKVIFDFDDAIYTVSEVREETLIEKFTYPRRVQKIISLCDSIVVGNEYLGQFASNYNKKVYVVPTSIDLTKYPMRLSDKQKRSPVIIGWIGTPSTAPYLNLISSALKEIATQNDIIFRVIGGSSIECPGVKVEQLPWSLKSEVEDICSLDIGVMPLTDDPWTRGKCGLKLLQYMAAGVPAVASPVGVNNKIISDGINGYLAKNNEEWVAKIKNLICFPNEHFEMIELARKTVEDEYSIEVNVKKLIDIFTR